MLRDGNTSFPLGAKEFQHQRRLVLQELASRFSTRALPGVFNSPPGVFERASIEPVIKTQDTIDIHSRNYATEDMFGGFDLSITYDGNEIILRMNPPNSRLHIDDLQFRIAHLYCTFLVDGLFHQPFLLSSERFGISLFYRELDFTKNQLVDLLQKMRNEEKEDGISPYIFIDRTTNRYALPIKDNIDYTRSIPDRTAKQERHIRRKIV